MLAARYGAAVSLPPLHYCTDNAAMIGLAAWHRLAAGHPSPLSTTAQPALGLDALAPA